MPNRTWINEHLTFTHGYGLTLGPVNQVTQEGLPVLYIKDLPPVSTVDLPVTQPSIYFGELSNDYVLRAHHAKEFHYPKGDDNVTTYVHGTGGVPVGIVLAQGCCSRCASGRSRSSSASDITPNSRVIFHRQISERVTRHRPVPGVRRRSLPRRRAMDGCSGFRMRYTTTDRYPYSTPAAGRHQLHPQLGEGHCRRLRRHDDLLPGGRHDPLALTYQRMFPASSSRSSEMPAAIRAHVRYPEAIFGLQTAAVPTFHMTNPVVFYNKEDQWEIPLIDSRRTKRARPMQPYYTIMRLPGEKDDEFIQMVPFTPRRKDNLCGVDGRAQRRRALRPACSCSSFPKQKVVFGPRQIIARINQDQVISPQITLWNQQGSEVIQGTLLVIPIEESLLYVRPLYLRGQGGRIPELKRVIVAYQNADRHGRDARSRSRPAVRSWGNRRIARPDRRAGSRPEISERHPPPVPSAASPEIADLAAQARSHYDRAIQAQRDGNWALYGDELKALGEVLQRMQAASGGKNR